MLQPSFIWTLDSAIQQKQNTNYSMSRAKVYNRKWCTVRDMGTEQRWDYSGGPVGMDTASDQPGGEATRRSSKTGQECEAAESGAGSLGGAGETDSSLRTSLFTAPSPCVCLCLAPLHSRRSSTLSFLHLLLLSPPLWLVPVRACLEFDSVVTVPCNQFHLRTFTLQYLVSGVALRVWFMVRTP